MEAHDEGVLGWIIEKGAGSTAPRPGARAVDGQQEHEEVAVSLRQARRDQESGRLTVSDAERNAGDDAHNCDEPRVHALYGDGQLDQGTLAGKLQSRARRDAHPRKRQPPRQGG